MTKQRGYGMVKVGLPNKHSNMQKNSTSKSLSLIKRMVNLPVLVVLSLVVVAGTAFPSVRADSVQDQINALQRENDANQSAVNDLQGQAVSYQDAIARLNSQIGLLQGQINDSIAKQETLKQQIAQKQIELDQQKRALAEDIKSMYVNGSMSTVEMLATSKDLSHFVDAETYRGAVQSKIQGTLSEIAKIQATLKSQKDQVVVLLQSQQNQQADLASARSQQNSLLSMNESQQAAYNAKTKANQSKISDLIAEQLRANSSSSPSGYYFLRFPGSAADHSASVNDYPYANAGFGMSTAPGCVDNDGPDRWGYCTRQCVSYAAWAVERSGRTAPTYYGNAKDWVSAARRQGVAVYTSNPQPGDVAISTAGAWGHAMYVERVSGNQIYVSQYNASLNGQYSTQWRTFN